MERETIAENLKTSGQCNCAQAVLIALKDDLGLDEETLLTIGSGFCAGMGNMEATCGAVIGANMALGLTTQGKGTLRYSRELISKFKEMSGATKCRDLKALKDGKPLCPCNLCVRNAVHIYEELIKLVKEK